MTAGRTSISTNKDWGTPPLYVTPVRSVLGKIWLDPCSNRHSIVGAEVEYALPSRDGLACSWNYPTIYVNPPYGADRELRNLTMKLFLGEQEAVKSAQDTHGHLSPEIMPQLEEIALAQMKNQEELLARENVVGEERERVNLALLMLNSWMMGMIGSMPSPMVSLFGKLSLDQFRELIEVHGGRQN